MPVKTIDLVKNLLKKAGVTHEGEIGEELPDEVATQLDNSLLTLQAATNNHPQVKKVYFAQAYNGLDAELNSLMDESGLDETAKAELKGETSSTQRAVKLVKKIKELSAKKDDTPDAGKAAKLTQEIADLHKQLRENQENLNKAKADYDNKVKQIGIQSKLTAKLNTYKTSFDEMDPEAKEAAINAIVQKALQDNDAEFTFDEKGNFTVIKKDGTNLFGDNHTQYTADTFLDKSLSKILKVNEPSPASNGNIHLPLF